MPDPPEVIFERARLPQISAKMLDAALAGGWRHFGTLFFRYNIAIHRGMPCRVQPLRIRVPDFLPSKSQRRILRQNADLDVRIHPARIDAAREDLFSRHAARFAENVPSSLLDFLDRSPATIPCECQEIALYDAGRLVAVSYFDIGHVSSSSIYAMFAPEYARRSLGIHTMMLEIACASRSFRTFHYSGYSYDIPSHYDYKKRFRGTEFFDWHGNWQALTAAR